MQIGYQQRISGGRTEIPPQRNISIINIYISWQLFDHNRINLVFGDIVIEFYGYIEEGFGGNDLLS